MGCWLSSGRLVRESEMVGLPREMLVLSRLRGGSLYELPLLLGLENVLLESYLNEGKGKDRDECVL